MTNARTTVRLAVPDGFTEYLRKERGVAPLTVDAYVSDVRRFLARHGGGLRELTFTTGRGTRSRFVRLGRPRKWSAVMKRHR